MFGISFPAPVWFTVSLLVALAAFALAQRSLMIRARISSRYMRILNEDAFVVEAQLAAIFGTILFIAVISGQDPLLLLRLVSISFAIVIILFLILPKRFIKDGLSSRFAKAARMFIVNSFLGCIVLFTALLTNDSLTWIATAVALGGVLFWLRFAKRLREDSP